MNDIMPEQSAQESLHTIHAATRTAIAATSYKCTDCGETATTPRGFSDQCDNTEPS